VLQAVVVGVVVERVGGRRRIEVGFEHREVGVVALRRRQSLLGAGLDPVDVGVDVVRVGLARVDASVVVGVLVAVLQSVVVAVVVERIGGGGRIGVGDEDREVGVASLRRGESLLGSVLDPVAVGVDVVGIGLARVDLAVVIRV